MKLKHIIVPVDFSESSRAALDLATSIARGTGATLHILHVKEHLVAYDLSREYANVSVFPDVDEIKAVLERVVPVDPDVPYRHWLFESEDVADEIVHLADELGADLIALGTHGRSGLCHLVMGSVAESVMRQARCPVLTIKQARESILEPVAGRLPS